MSNKLTSEVVALIFTTSQILREKIRTRANFKECSFLHMQTLHYIQEQDNLSMKDLANYLHITPPSATSLVNSLVARGWVARIVDKRDRRAIKLRILPAGYKLLKSSFAGLAALMGEGINKLSDHEKKTFIKILNKITY